MKTSNGKDTLYDSYKTNTLVKCYYFQGKNLKTLRKTLTKNKIYIPITMAAMYKVRK